MKASHYFRPAMSNQPAGRMQPSGRFCAAQLGFAEV